MGDRHLRLIVALGTASSIECAGQHDPETTSTGTWQLPIFQLWLLHHPLFPAAWGGLSAHICMRCRDGCHHCGRRRGKVVGDHIPPNKLAAVNSAVLPDSLTQLLQQPLASLHKRTRSRFGIRHQSCINCYAQAECVCSSTKTPTTLAHCSGARCLSA